MPTDEDLGPYQESIPEQRMVITCETTQSILFTAAAGSQSFYIGSHIGVSAFEASSTIRTADRQDRGGALGSALRHQAQQKSLDKNIVRVRGIKQLEFAYCLWNQT